MQDDVTPLGSLSQVTGDVDIDDLLGAASSRSSARALDVNSHLREAEKLELDVAFEVTESIATAVTHEQVAVVAPTPQASNDVKRVGDGPIRCMCSSC